MMIIMTSHFGPQMLDFGRNRSTNGDVEQTDGQTERRTDGQIQIIV